MSDVVLLAHDLIWESETNMLLLFFLSLYKLFVNYISNCFISTAYGIGSTI